MPKGVGWGGDKHVYFQFPIKVGKGAIFVWGKPGANDIFKVLFKMPPVPGDLFFFKSKH